MGVLLRIIISRDLDGLHVNQARFNGKWYHISIRGFNSLGTNNNFGLIINLGAKPFHLTEVLHIAHFWISYGRHAMPGLPMRWSEGLSW